MDGCSGGGGNIVGALGGEESAGGVNNVLSPHVLGFRKCIKNVSFPDDCNKYIFFATRIREENKLLTSMDDAAHNIIYSCSEQKKTDERLYHKCRVHTMLHFAIALPTCTHVCTLAISFSFVFAQVKIWGMIRNEYNCELSVLLGGSLRLPCINSSSSKYMPRANNCEYFKAGIAGAPSCHIAFACWRGKVLAYAQNTCGIHAEMALIYQHHMRSYRCHTGLEIYVMRVGANQTHSMSRPCKNCSYWLKKWNPNMKVFYTDAAGTWQRDHHLDNTWTPRCRRC